jgi:hypothetical protein
MVQLDAAPTKGRKVTRRAVISAILTVIVCALAASARPAAAGSARDWCNAVIQVNTKYGTMKNKRFVPISKVPLSAWKKVVDAAVAGRNHYLALAPSSIKTAVKHQLSWFANVKANHYSSKTPLAPMTIADVKKITEFERTKCGIKFSNG